MNGSLLIARRGYCHLFVLDKGNGQGRRVVPADWLQQSFTPRNNLLDELPYGFFWWLAGENSPPHGVAGNYERPDAWQLPVRIITEFAVPAIRWRIPARTERSGAFELEGYLELGPISLHLAIFDHKVLRDHFGDAQIPQRLGRAVDSRRGRLFPGFRAGADQFDDFIDAFGHAGLPSLS